MCVVDRHKDIIKQRFGWDDGEDKTDKDFTKSKESLVVFLFVYQ